MNETAVQTRMNGRLPEPIVAAIKPVMDHIADLLPPDIKFQEFRAALWLELTNRRGLEECMPETIAECCIKAGQAGMLPHRDCHFLPFNDKRRGGRKAATFVENYFGILRALDRTEKVAKAFAHPVYAGDRFEVDFLDDQFHHTPAALLTPARQRGTLSCFYACILRKDGTRHLEVMTLDEIDAVKRRAPAHESGPWVSDYEMMARKTVIKRVAKYVQLTPEVSQILRVDDDRMDTDFNPERGRQAAIELFDDPKAIGKPPGTPSATLMYAPETGEVIEPSPDDIPDAGVLPPGLQELLHDLGNRLYGRMAKLTGDEKLTPPWDGYLLLHTDASKVIDSDARPAVVEKYESQVADVLEAIKELKGHQPELV